MKWGRAMLTDKHDDQPKENPEAASGQPIGTSGAPHSGTLTMRVLHSLWNAFLDGAAVYGACAHGWPVRLMD
jgi:hypothetical protein